MSPMSPRSQAAEAVMRPGRSTTRTSAVAAACRAASGRPVIRPAQGVAPTMLRCSRATVARRVAVGTRGPAGTARRARRTAASQSTRSAAVGAEAVLGLTRLLSPLIIL